jgi:hypothetical protein
MAKSKLLETWNKPASLDPSSPLKRGRGKTAEGEPRLRRGEGDDSSLLESGELFEELVQVLRDVLAIGKKENKKTGFCIGNTTKKIDRDYFFTPIRNTSRCVAGSIVIDRVAIAEIVTRAVDGRVDYIFVDTEKKISPELYSLDDVGNVERAVRQSASKSKVLTYKGNDLTVDAVDCFLAQCVTSDVRGLGGKKAAIIGAGNIGFKLALKLTERGCHVVMARRNTKVLNTIVRALNYIKPRSTIAKIIGTSDIQAAMVGADIVIGLTPGTQDITVEMVQGVKDGAVLIDAGKGSFSGEAVAAAESRKLQIYRASIAASFEGQIAMLLKMEEVLEREVGRREVEGIFIISGSLMGRKGDLVVDNIFNPTQIYGVADGCGDFNRTPSDEELENIRILKDLFQLGRE